MTTFRKSLILAVVVTASSQATAILPTPTDVGNTNSSNADSSSTSNTNTNKVIFKQYSTINNQISNRVHNKTAPVNITSNLQAQPMTTSDSRYADIYAQSHHIDKTTEAFVVTNVDGQEQLVPVDASTKIHAGDLIEYQGKFTNNLSTICFR